jgi:ankyrin repeat protein
VLAQKAKELDIPLVHFSTDYVFDGLKKGAYVETDETNPQSVYGKTKWEGEEKVRVHHKHIILRTSWVFGSHGNNFLKTMLRLIQEKDSPYAKETLDKYKFTPLTMAAYSGAFETVKYLCSKGADPTKGAAQQAKNPAIKQYLQEQCRPPPVNVRPAAAAPVAAAPVAPPPAPTKKANKSVKAKANTRPAGSNAPLARANTRPAGSNAGPAKPNNKTRRRRRGPTKRGQTKKNTAAP